MLPSKSCKLMNANFLLKNFGLTFFDRFKTGTYLVNWFVCGSAEPCRTSKFGRYRCRCRFIGRSLEFWLIFLCQKNCWCFLLCSKTFSTPYLMKDFLNGQFFWVLWKVLTFLEKLTFQNSKGLFVQHVTSTLCRGQVSKVSGL